MQSFGHELFTATSASLLGQYDRNKHILQAGGGPITLEGVTLGGPASLEHAHAAKLFLGGEHLPILAG